MVTQSTVALIDGDIIVYRCAFACERNMRRISWDGGSETFRYKKELDAFIEENALVEYEIETYLEVEPLDHALSSVKSTIATIFKATKPTDYKIYLTKGECFRHKQATIAKYKGNRDNQRRPKWYDEVREYLLKYYEAIITEGYEADDILAREQTDNTIICSIDKDLLQVPGKHYNWVTDKKLKVSPATGRLNLWSQVLTGDGTDNIPGIKGIGPVGARKLLAECTTDEEMRSVCTAKWAAHLAESPPDWVVGIAVEHPDPIECSYTCKHWNGEEIVMTADDVVDEILMLVKVG